MSVATEHKIPSTILSRLGALRRKLTGWLLVDGISRLLMAVCIIALLDAGIDRIFKMDLPQRTIMLCVMSILVLAVLFWRVIKPLTQSVSDDALILEVEKNNRDLKESLISSVQFSRDAVANKQGVSSQMVQATIDRGAEMAKSVNFGSALNKERQASNMVLLLLGIIGIGLLIFGVSTTYFWNTWFNRNILLTDAQWPQDTYLVIEGAENGRITMKRGEDHRQLVRVDGTVDEAGNPAPGSRSRVVDVSVELEVDTGNNRTFHQMNKTGPLEHQFDFRNVSSQFKFRARGGDETTGWVQVDLVDPPSISELELEVTGPEYIQEEAALLPKGSGPHGVLEGSSLSIAALSNKPLSVANLINPDGGEMKMTAGDDNTRFTLDIPTDKLLGGKYTFNLVDENGLTSSRPTSFSIAMKADRAPQLRASLNGISGLVTPKALIPISFRAKDEYSITATSVYAKWQGDSSSSVPQEVEKPIAGIEDLLNQKIVQAETAFDLRELEIPVGVGLRLSVKAVDNNTLSGPGIGQSREFLLRVVSEEELRADLLRREIEQRQAFELALKNQEQLTVDLRALAAKQLEQADEDNDKVLSRLVDMQRRQKIVGTNLANIANRFESFLIEARNNRLDESDSNLDESMSIEKRLSEKIIAPIRSLDAEDIFIASQSFDVVRRSVADPEQMAKAAGDTAGIQEEIQAKMRQILSAMQDSETYQQIINQAIETKRAQEEVRKMNEEKKADNQNQGIFDDEDGIFDDPESGENDGDDEENNENNE